MKNCSSDWKNKPFPECIKPVKFERSKQIKTNSYLPSGNFPIIDQGQTKIAGWTNDNSAVIKDNIPLIIFGDHTRVFKYIDFPFAIGADGTKLIKPRDDKFCSRYFYYYLRSLNLPSKGYSRHFKLLKESEISYPEMPEQEKIATVLLKIQQAIEVQESIIETAQELKKSTMQHVVTYGLRGEKTKETEIGRMPESWEVQPLGSILTLNQYGLSVRGSTKGRYPMLRMNCQTDGKVIFDNLQYVELDKKTFEKFKLKDGDILFNRTNSWELVGRTAIFHSDEEAVFASYLIRLRINPEKVNPDFINYFFNMDSTQQKLKTLASRGVSQSNISASKLRTFYMPIAKLNEQIEIVKILQIIDSNIEYHISKKIALQDLFKTALNKLMTGVIRVKDSDIDTSCVLEMKNRG